MDWIDIKGLQDEEQQIIETYNKINEETRLNLSNSSSIEFLTNTKYVENMLENKSSILELGAGTGVYSIYFANKGFDVTAVELSKRNVSIFKSKIPDTISVDVITGNALKMDYLCDKYFDAVLSFGPLYHISSFKDRINCLKESLRVLKDDGYLFITLINNDMVPMVEMQY